MTVLMFMYEVKNIRLCNVSDCPHGVTV